MDTATRQFVQVLLADNESLAQQASLTFRVAQLMQQVAELHGGRLGIPTLKGEMTVADLRRIEMDLAVRVQGATVPEMSRDMLQKVAAVARDRADAAGARVPVAAGGGPGDDTDGD
jgi:hypothetical protein